MSFNMVNSKLSEAWNNELPPIGFSVDYSGTAMTVEKFPESDCYLRLSRPPRGSLEFVVKAYRNRKHDLNTLRNLIQDFGFDNGKILDMGVINLAEIDRIACEFLTGYGLSCKKWKAAIIPSPDGGPYGLLVIFGLYVGSSRSGKLAKISKHPVFKTLIDNFQLLRIR